MSSASGRVLLICYYFPPLGGAGVGRPLSLAKYLPEFGYECDVLTVKPVTYRVYEPKLLEEIDSSRIYRAGSWDPQRLMYLLGMRTFKEKLIESGRKASDKFFPDSKVGWVKPAVGLGRQLLSGQNYDAIISTSPPMSSHLVASRLAKETGLPWIADFRDFWTSYKVEDHFEDEAMVKRGLALCDKIMAEAQAVTVVNQSIAEYLGKGRVIPNSFDIQLAASWKSATDSNKYVIGLFGTFDDVIPAEPLLRVLSRLKEKSESHFRRVTVRQVGNTNRAQLADLAERFNLGDCIEYLGFLPRSEAFTELSDAAIFYIGLPSDSTHEIGITPGRIFDLLASGRPILAAAPPDSEIGRLVIESQNGICFEPEELDRAVTYLESQIESYQQKITSIKPLPEYALKYSSDRMVAAFADSIAKLVGC